jgi:dolichol-phosphate mannosyltransferase
VAPHARGSLVAIVPTRNEARSLEWLIPRLIAVGAAVVVVDDASPDRTAAAAERLIRRHRGRGTVMRRTGRRGRGSAVLDGLRLALARYPRASAFVELDADGSHDPAEIARLLRAMRARRADLVIGARIPRPSPSGERWPLHRRLFHRANGALIGGILRLPTSDPTNGFRLWGRAAAELLVTVRFRESGFIWVAESTDALRRAGGRISEVETGFYPRIAGRSKAGLGEIARSLRGLLRIAFAPPRVRSLEARSPRRGRPDRA